MNFLNGGCLSRYSRAPFWNIPCCKDINKPAQLIDLGKVQKRAQCKTKPVKLLTPNRCSWDNRILSSMASWTQVRFNDKCPNLHRDLEYPNFDPYRKDEYKDVRKTHWGSGESKPGITYAVGVLGWLSGYYGTKTVATHFITYMSAAADVLALASIEVDIGKIAPGACLSYKWRGKPLFVKHRTQADIDSEANTPMGALKDPETPDKRAPNPQWLIVIGICTHLGCVPIPNSGDWPGGFYCPCHGSHYDNVGRARKGPAPLNLEVPPYKFVSDTVVLVG